MSKQRTTAQWPPPELLLPDSIEEIERGRPDRLRQQPLPLAPDNSREARLRRLLGTVPGIVTADKLDAKGLCYAGIGPPGLRQLRFRRFGRYAGPITVSARTGAFAGLWRDVKMGNPCLRKFAAGCNPRWHT